MKVLKNPRKKYKYYPMKLQSCRVVVCIDNGDPNDLGAIWEFTKKVDMDTIIKQNRGIKIQVGDFVLDWKELKQARRRYENLG